MNKLQCETCMNLGCPLMMLQGEESDTYYFIMDCMSKVGCASHSDTGKEREKTINEFYERLKVERDAIFDGVSWDDVDAVFIKLRQGGE